MRTAKSETAPTNGPSFSCDGRTGVAMATGGSGQSAFCERDGTLWATGGMDLVKLGDWNQIQVPPGSDLPRRRVGVLMLGESHTLFIKTDRTLWAVGKQWLRGAWRRNDELTFDRVAVGVVSPWHLRELLFAVRCK